MTKQASSTPGPWTVADDKLNGHLGFTITAPTSSVGGTSRGHVATVDAQAPVATNKPRSWTLRGQPESAANARLIAAAPDLLAAAEAVRDYLGLPLRPNAGCALCNGPYGSHIKDCPALLVEAAIEKAKGVTL